MVTRPLDVENTPDLIDLTLLARGSSASGYSHGDEGRRYRPSMPGLHPKIDGRDVPHPRLTLQGVEILRLGTLPFAEDQDRLSWLADRNPTFEQIAAATPLCEGGVKADGEMSEHRCTN